MNNLPSSDSVTPSPSPVKPKFGLRWWILLPLAPLLGESIYSEYDGTSNGFSRSAGHFVGGILIGLLFAWLGWLFSRRSRFVASLTFVIIVLMAVAGGVLERHRHLQQETAERQVLAEIEHGRGEVAAHLQRLAAGEDVHDKLLDQIDAHAAQIDSSAKNLPSNDATAMAALVAVTQELTAKVRQFQQHLNELKPYLNIAGLKDLGDIDHALTLVDQCTNQVDALDTYAQGMPQQFLKIITDAGSNPQRADAEVRAFTQGLHLPLIHEIRETDRTILRGMHQMLTTLKDHWGQWQFDSASRKTLFASSQVAEQFNAAVTQIQTASQQQMQLQRQYADEMTRNTPASPAP